MRQREEPDFPENKREKRAQENSGAFLPVKRNKFAEFPPGEREEKKRALHCENGGRCETGADFRRAQPMKGGLTQVKQKAFRKK